jgi:hypothetical protein
MQVLILIEPKEGGGFRATAGEPFRLSAEADSEAAAADQLETLLRSRLKGARLAILDLPNGSKEETKPSLRFEPIPGEDWFFKTMREAIEENRRIENEAQG